MGVGHKQFGAGQNKPACRLAAGRDDPGGIPARIGLGPGEAHLGRARRDAWQPFLALGR